MTIAVAQQDSKLDRREFSKRFERVFYLSQHPEESIGIDVSFPANFASVLYGGRIAHEINRNSDFVAWGIETIHDFDITGIDRNLRSEYKVRGHKAGAGWFARIFPRDFVLVTYHSPHGSIMTPKAEVIVYEPYLLEAVGETVQRLNSETGLGFTVR